MWTKEEKRLLAEMYKAGKSYKEMAKTLKKSKDAITSALKRYGIYKNAGYRKKPTKKMRERKKKKTYNPNPVTYTTRMIICCAAHRGETIEQIAKDIDRPAYIVQHILKQCMENGFYKRINLEKDKPWNNKRYREIYMAVLRAYERVAPFI